MGEGGPWVGEWYAGIMVQSQTGLVEAAIFHREYLGTKTTKEVISRDAGRKDAMVHQ